MLDQSKIPALAEIVTVDPNENVQIDLAKLADRIQVDINGTCGGVLTLTIGGDWGDPRCPRIKLSMWGYYTLLAALLMRFNARVFSLGDRGFDQPIRKQLIEDLSRILRELKEGIQECSDPTYNDMVKAMTDMVREINP